MSARTSARPAHPLPRRLPLMVLGVLSLLAGLWGGLLLLGLHVPVLRATTAADHGPLMALGFLGTVISLERAVALRRAWGYLAPAAAGVGALALVAGAPGAFGWGLLCLASVVFVVIYVVVLQIAPALHLVAMGLGALCWYLATVLWFANWSIPRLVPWLAGFLVLTILGERLELARVAIVTPASRRAFLTATAVFGAGLIVASLPGATAFTGVRIAGAGLVLLALWGARYDVARRTVRVPGVTRFMAVCLLSGYAWLAAGGGLWLALGDLGAGVAGYDAALHAIFLGFVMSMIFGHAPVIVPAVLGVRLPFRPWFYLHLGLLHLALLVRLVPGDAFGVRVAWQVGGAGTEVAVLAFLAVSAAAVLAARRRKPRIAAVPRDAAAPRDGVAPLRGNRT